jgi:hypothetical protein
LPGLWWHSPCRRAAAPRRRIPRTPAVAAAAWEVAEGEQAAALPESVRTQERAEARASARTLERAGARASLLPGGISTQSTNPPRGRDSRVPAGKCSMMALGSIASKRLTLPGTTLMRTAAQMLTGGASMLVVSSWLGESMPAAPTTRAIAAVVYLAVFGSVIGFSAYVYELCLHQSRDRGRHWHRMGGRTDRSGGRDRRRRGGRSGRAGGAIAECAPPTNAL